MIETRVTLPEGKQQVSPFYHTSHLAYSEDFDFYNFSSPGFSDAEDDRVEGALAIKLIIGLDFAVTLSSPASFLHSFRYHFRTIGRTEMADVEQTQKMIPFVTSEVSLGQYVCELVSGVNIFDLDFRVKIDSIEQPIKSNSVGPGNMSHCVTFSFL